MSLYKQFKTDTNLETNGIIIDYGSTRITIARAGGSNKRFGKVLDAKTRPVRRAIQTETLENEKFLDILRESYAEAIILKWETKIDEEWKEGIEGEDGELMPVNPANIVKTLKALPDLFTDLQEQASKAALFRQSLRDEDVKN